jgi:hypothetical protein
MKSFCLLKFPEEVCYQFFSFPVSPGSINFMSWEQEQRATLLCTDLVPHREGCFPSIRRTNNCVLSHCSSF